MIKVTIVFRHYTRAESFFKDYYKQKYIEFISIEGRTITIKTNMEVDIAIYTKGIFLTLGDNYICFDKKEVTAIRSDYRK